MPNQPGPGDLRINELLMDVSLAEVQDTSMFVATKVFPFIQSSKQGGQYARYTRAFWNRNNVQKRASGAESAGAGWEVDNTGSYFCDVYALHHDISNQDLADAADVFDLESDAARFLTYQGLLNLEIQFATEFMTTSVWTGSSTGSDIATADITNDWDSASGTPVADIRQQARSILKKTGIRPNKLVVGRAVHDALLDNADVQARVRPTQNTLNEPITRAQLATVFEVEQYLVMEAVKNTADEGATESNSFVGAEDDALLCYAAPRPSKLMPTAGGVFVWTGLNGGANEIGVTISQMDAPLRKSTRYEFEHAFDMKQIAPELGCYFDGVVTP